MSLPDLTQQVLHGNRDVVELQGTHRRPLQPEQLLLGTHREAGGLAFQQKRGEGGAVDLGEQDEEVGPSGVGDPLLGAIDDVVCALRRENRRRRDVHRIGSGPRLGQGERRHQLA